MKTALFLALFLSIPCAFSEESPTWKNMSKGDLAIDDKALESAKDWAENYYSGVEGIVEYAYRVSGTETELNIMITPIYSGGFVIEHSDMCLDIGQSGKVANAKNCYAP